MENIEEKNQEPQPQTSDEQKPAVEVFVYAGPTFNIPEKGISLTFGKTFSKKNKKPKLPKELKFLRDFFLPITEYPKKKMEMKGKHKTAMAKISDYVKKLRKK